MDDAVTPVVERTLDLPGDPSTLWDLITDPAAWLADAGELDAVEGAEGRLVDDGVERHAVVESVVEGERLVYRWWPSHGPHAGEVSRVEIELLPAAVGTQVVVRETWPSRSLPVAVDGVRWEVRAACLSAATSAASLRVAA